MINFFNQRLLLLALITSFSSPLMALDYYVDQSHPEANDTNPGSEVLPWKTIQKAADTLTAGNRVLVKSGEYTELPDRYPDKPVKGIKPQKSGTDNNPIIYQEAPGHRVIINQQNQGSGFYLVNKAYITIKGFEIKNAYDGGIYANYTNNNIVIEDNHIHHVDGSRGANIGAVRLNGCSNCVVRNNKLHDVKVGGDQTNQNGAGVHSFDMTNALIENNEIFNVASGVFHKRSGSVNIPGAVIRRNIIHDTHLYGLYYSVSGAGDKAHYQQNVYENIFYNIGNACVYASVNETSSLSQGIYIYNNTFDGSGVFLTGFAGAEIYNNIFYKTQGWGKYAIITTNQYGHTSRLDYAGNNLYFDNGTNILDLYGAKERKFNSLDEWKNANPSEVETLNIIPGINSFESDPLFNSTTYRDYLLKPTSPGLASNGAVARLGSPNNAVNMGAYSDSSQNIVIGPVSVLSQPIIVSD